MMKRAATIAVLFALPAAARACAVCGGAIDENIVEASNTVLWTLLALVGFIFSATGGTIWYLWRKASTPIPPHIALIESLSREDLTSDS
jgi:hypothetical protein